METETEKHKDRDKQIQNQTDRQKNRRRTEGWTDRQTDRQIETEVDRQRDTRDRDMYKENKIMKSFFLWVPAVFLCVLPVSELKSPSMASVNVLLVGFPYLMPSC